MQKMSELEPFDYDELDMHMRIYLQQQEYNIKSLLQATWIEIGMILDGVQKEIPPLTFKKWLTRFCVKLEMKNRTAENMLYAARVILEKSSVPNENFAFLNISKSAGYLLPSMTDAAQREAIAIAESGEELTRAKALEIKSKYQQGSTVTVQGEDAIVLEVQGKIITTDRGVFLPGHLDDAPIPKTYGQKEHPVHPVALLESRLSLARAREAYLIELLTKMYHVSQGRSLASTALIEEVRDAIA